MIRWTGWSTALHELFDRWRLAAESSLSQSETDLWEAGWYEALRSASEALNTTDDVVGEIVLHGEPWARMSPGRLLRLEDIAARVGRERNVRIVVSLVHEAPVVRLSLAG
jgi:hypothetical protein